MAGRWIVVAIAVGLPLAIAGQNWQMTVALVVLGQSTLALPVGLWMAMAIAAGLVTSLLLGLLLGMGGRSRDRLDWSAKEKPTYVRQRSARQRSVESLAEEVWETAQPPEEQPAKPSRRSPSEPWDETAYEEAEADAIAREWAGEPRKRQPRRRRSDPAATAAAFEEEMAGWSEPDRPAKGWSGSRSGADRSRGQDPDLEDLDWEEEAPPEPPQPRSPRTAPRPTPPPPAPPVERSQRPVRQDRQGSVYSYSYREGDGPDETSGANGEEEAPRTLIPPPPKEFRDSPPPEDFGELKESAAPILDEGPNPEPLEPVRLPEPKRPPALDLPPPETRSRSVMDADYRVLRPPADPAGDRPNRRPADRTASGEDWDDWDDWDQPAGDRPEESW